MKLTQRLKDMGSYTRQLRDKKYIGSISKQYRGHLKVKLEIRRNWEKPGPQVPYKKSGRTRGSPQFHPI
jgi:hypothetical protein